MIKLTIYALLFLTIAAGCGKKGGCLENPKADCICTMEYNPVCGCNGKTYSNACQAECSSITEYTQGECK